ncbi:putative disease resistance RPP13-like protein 1 [Pistacia vera]|uniref:putative disease resistance RPP13-like protein 1 n=1 Tax=Pistacia vera TaxID=55513 RepID=UPI001263C469|nr:putative disease resistance RPP13-like protein 1 [Pistacia vera]
MVLSEVFLSAFLQLLFDRLASRELMNFAQREGVPSKLKKWEKTLKMIEAVLNDAEEKQLTDGAVKMWLDDLQDLAYDVEDILEEFATEVVRCKLEEEDQASTSKAQSLIPSCLGAWRPSAFKFNTRIRSKIKDITRRMQDLCKQRNDLGLEKIAGGPSIPAEWQRPPPTTSLPIESAVYGREEDKARIIKIMSTAESGYANFLVIPIVGMGGIGKTTLAQHVFNDKAMEDFKFDKKAWVCVSSDFDILRISKAIMESFTFSSCDLKDLNPVQLQLKEAVSGKKFLLVLDDVWSTNYGLWETLKSPFMAGASGSIIIVTTRNENVAKTIAPGVYNLKLLSDYDCWSVFVKHAFDDRDLGARRNVEMIRQKVIEKCRGLPLAARTLGGLLHSKTRDDEWDNILNSKIWDLPNENEILPVLMLSYHHLPSHEKRCFAYCAILPKGYEFEEKELVLLWMAEGLIRESRSNRQLEDLGSEYFRDLVSRSIFQRSSSNNSKFLMHDLVNDLAQWVSEESSFRLDDVMAQNKQLKSAERVRHSSYISHTLDGKNKFEIFHKLENLRTFLPIVLLIDDDEDDEDNYYYISHMVLSDLLLKFKKLRVLSLRRYYITEIPDSIKVLKHLRYLNLSHTQIRNLPESTCSLLNLQSLILRNCFRLLRLPLNMRNLISLRHLDIRGVNLLKNMPLGMKELRCLRTLSNFIVGKDTGSRLKDLKDLKFLQGELCISRLENVNEQDIGETILRDKKDLEMLSLKWRSQSDNSSNKAAEENVLDMLRPHGNIKGLIINGYGGKRFPSWIGDSSFSNLVVLRLESCAGCSSLPPLGQLSSLKDLTIRRMTEIKNIGSEIFGEKCSEAFKSLETLSFEDLQEWMHWNLIQESENVEIFPQLLKLSIVKCPKLIGRLPDKLPSLVELEIHECSQLVVSCPSLPTGSNNPADSNSQNASTPENFSEFDNWLQQGYQKLQRLSIVNCEKLASLWHNEISLETPPLGLQTCNSFKSLRIQDFPTLVSFPEVGNFPSLRMLEIVTGDFLSTLTQEIKHGNICPERLRIEGRHSITFIEKGRLPPSLKSLEIINCEKLEVLFDDIEDTFSLESLCVENCPSLTCLSSRGQLPDKLKHLEIRNCSNLTTFSLTGELPLSLTNLKIWDCSKLESIAEKFGNNMSLRSIRIKRCENLNSLPEGLHNLNCLYEIDLSDCPNLVSFPEGGLPNNNLTEVSFSRCEKLEGPPNHSQSLGRLQYLIIEDCPSVRSFPVEGCPTSLIGLSVLNNLEIYKSLREWGFHKFISLSYLEICGCSDVVCFPQEEMGMMLPSSLTDLIISKFPQLKSLSSKGFQELLSLETLEIKDCPRLISFPEEGLPSSLLQLYIYSCPLLEKQCRRDKGREWSKIADIPCVEINGRFIYNPEEEE